MCTAIVRPRKELRSSLPVLPSNCLQSPSHFVLRNVGNDSHMMNFDSDKRFDMVNTCHWPIPVAARPKARVCGLSLAGITGSIPAGCLSLLSVVCCRVEFSGTG